MKVSIDITDEKQLAQIEELRGDRSAEEYARIVFTAGLQMAAFQRQQHRDAEAKGQILRFSSAKPEFKTLDPAAIAEALKGKDPQNPIVLEVSRLVQDIGGQLKQYAEKNGNKLPPSLQVNASAPIEKIAFQITSEIISVAAKGAAAKAAQQPV
ncbi:MAG: hypothetical protein EPN97_00655 [Alphaproteobacteria bacterium]|nr:MAG: hypothetical protein EPN97_00655 [Alphaproteobacteria bacterium]